MNDIKLTELLGIKDIEITKTDIDTVGHFLIYVKTKTDEIHCRKCGRKTEKCHGVADEVKLRHLPMGNRVTYIVIKPKRGRCKTCDGNPTSNQKTDWYSFHQRQTKLYESHILLSAINSTVTDVSLKEGLGYKEVEGILSRNIDSEINWDKIKAIGALGIDEIAVKKGYSGYLTIISSHVRGVKTILKVIEGKKKEDVALFLRTIPKPLRKTIIAVCTDMYDGYVNAAKEVFGSTVPVVIDRYHLSDLYRGCMDTTRIKELKRLRKKLSEKEYKKLKEAISILQKNAELITDEERKKLKQLFKHSPDLKRAYRLCRKITSIFNSHIPKRSASKRINNWIEDAQESGLPAFQKICITFEERQKEIVNYFKDRQNSGFVEGINNKIKVTKRRCYGLSDPKTFFLRLFLDFSGYLFLGVTHA